MLEALSERRIELFRPYEKQAEFLAAGKTHRERLLMAANRFGKTRTGGYETAVHLTGRYPDDWWQGRRFDHPVDVWACGKTNLTTRDVPQMELLGPPHAIGTGMIPKEDILDITMARGIPDAIDKALIRHVPTGGRSTLQFKSYEQGYAKFFGTKKHVVWLDEEPTGSEQGGWKIYSECLTRTNETGGLVYITFTPLEGMSTVVLKFYPEPSSADRYIVQATLDDVPDWPEGHFEPGQKEKIIASYEDWEVEARTQGIPMLGEGRVWTFPEEDFIVEPFKIPDHFAQIIGTDFGWDHPFAAARLAWDRDAGEEGTVYLTSEFKQRKCLPAVRADALRSMGGTEIPVSWPHDAHKADSSGDEEAAVLRNKGIRMLATHATHPSGGIGTEDAINALTSRFSNGTFKVFENCKGFLAEYRNYHRKDGKLVKLGDDLISAVLKGHMMLRFARARVILDALPAEADDWNPIGLVQ